MQDPWAVGEKFLSFPSKFFAQPFQYFQKVNLVDCLSSCYKFTMNNPSNIKFANFIGKTRIWTESYIQIFFKTFRKYMLQNSSECLSLSFKDGCVWFGHDVRSNGGQVIYSKDQEHELVSAILKLSACGFWIRWDSVTNAAFSFTQSKRIQ